MEAGEHPPSWYSTNLVGVPTWILASIEFNAHPRAMHIGGTRSAHHGLFALLARCSDVQEAGDVFAHYMTLAFGLQPLEPDKGAQSSGEARRWRSNYIKLLQGWGLDSSGPAGAVLKGWVESRFGLVPAFHKAVLARFPSPAWVTYLEQKVSSRYHNNGIYQQLDLLYEYGQWVLGRFKPFGEGPRITLWRGISRGEQQVVVGRWSTSVRHGVMRLNNLVSLSTRADQAECFGDWLLRIEVPVCKLLYFPGLLKGVPLNGEGEVLAIGGDYEVEVCHG
ncbi:NAD(+)--dinitrogen-reductase ADP-D-ribosyltransferase [Aquabacterium sp.]|uniref:NAD(+)--dinitrogen-reductase ADP-D-ribosyltransferase n=1 Tax=Aquabacterium sp. TaxID=1872578 RepID=UPI0025C4D8A4|nr:NAD(+)--dinitrogen-reductase ADP-D-ribosyltransferase [Aquabacterium sp.]